MAWEEFKRRAKALCERFFFKKTQEGYEVWERAKILLPGEHDGYLVMRVPYSYLPMPGFTWGGTLQTLKRIHVNRLEHKQLQQIKDMRSDNDAMTAQKKVEFEKETMAFAKEARSSFIRLAEETGVTKGSTIGNLAKREGISVDEAKKELYRQFEE